ncbi:MAG: SGNH/GDSL hydrolase family protein [Nitrospirota bacterium]|nr:SGNH/GDSL hydrolase family protein [Nitrospirota bacterium]
MGYREREFDRAKQLGVYRIAFIGDSFAFGQGIAERERISNILEAELRQERSGVEVLNFGRPGYNTADEVRVLRTEVLPTVAPDFVLLQWYFNDVELKQPQVDASVGNTLEVERDRVNELKQMMLNKSVIYFLLADLSHRVRAKVGMGYAEEMVSRTAGSGGQEILEAKMAMVEFLRLCKEKNVPVAVLLVPDLAPLGARPYPFTSLHLNVLEWCRQEGVTCVDLFPVFEPYLRDSAKCETLWVNRFDAHMSALANRLATTRLLEVFGPVWKAGQSMSPSSS